VFNDLKAYNGHSYRCKKIPQVTEKLLKKRKINWKKAAVAKKQQLEAAAAKPMPNEQLEQFEQVKLFYYLFSS
jgi:hypothetical protein